MSTYRTQLPQLGDRLFVTDGGLETTFIFHDGIDLPYFAAFDLLQSAQGTERLRRYYERYARIAAEHGLGMVLEAPTWRASRDWGAKLGYDARGAGCREPPGDRPDAGAARAVRGARPADGDQRQHRPARRRLRAGPADVDRGGARLSRRADRHLRRHRGRHGGGVHDELRRGSRRRRTGRARRGACRSPSRSRSRPTAACRAATARRRDHAHRRSIAGPSRVLHDQLRAPDALRACAGKRRRGATRIRGLRANASRRSHAELDESTDLDAGDPEELGGEYRALRPWLPRLSVVGGCCGTDHRHVAAMCAALLQERTSMPALARQAS